MKTQTVFQRCTQPQTKTDQPRRVFHVTGRTETGDVYDVTAIYSDGFEAINAAIDAGVLGAVARPMGVLQ